MTHNIKAAQRLQAFIDNDLLIRDSWIGEKDGRETACLLAAMVPECGEQRSASYCPAEVMPTWLAYMTPDIDDKGSDDAWPGMVRRYAACAARWHVLDDDAWRRVLLATLRECLVIVQPYDVSSIVAPMISLIDEGASASDPRWCVAAESAAASAAARARAAEAEAAEAAVWAAWSAARADAAADAAAAMTAAWAARAAMTAAEVEVAAAEAAAWTAREVAWDRITNALFAALEHECSALEDQGSQE